MTKTARRRSGGTGTWLAAFSATLQERAGKTTGQKKPHGKTSAIGQLHRTRKWTSVRPGAAAGGAEGGGKFGYVLGLPAPTYDKKGKPQERGLAPFYPRRNFAA